MGRIVFGEAKPCPYCHGIGVFASTPCRNCGGRGFVGLPPAEPAPTRAENVQTGRALRDEALDRVDRHADPTWMANAEAAGRRIAAHQPEFTTDDVWAALDAAGIPKPHERRAMGPVMMALKRDRIIVATGHFDTTERPIAHAAPIRVWRSLIYKE